MAGRITRRLYQGRVTVTGERTDAPTRDLVSPKIQIRVTKVTARDWPYPPKVGQTLWVSLHPRGSR
jgi:hypothetical protein